MPDRIEERARLDLVRYANVWEDAEVARAALAPGPGKRMLSIASAGDNAFVVLARGAEGLEGRPPQSPWLHREACS